jgi:hypothetical protein
MASLQDELTSSQEERARLQQKITLASTTLERIDASVLQQGKRILAALESLPDSQEKALEAVAGKVREVLLGRLTTADTLQKMRRVLALATDLERAQSSVHVATEILDIEGAGRMEVDVLYLGGAFGYYLSRDGRHAGILLPDRDGLRVAPRGAEVGESIRRARAVFLKEEPAALVELPVIPEGES